MQRKVIRICVSNQALSGAGLSRPYELPEVHRRLASRRKRYVPGTQLKSLIASTVVDVLTHGRTRVERGYGRSDGERSRIQEDDWAAKPLRRLSRNMDRNEFTGARLGSAAQNPSRSRRSDGPTKGSLLVSASAVNTNAPARHGSWASQSRGLRNRVGRDAAHERRILPPEHSQKRAAPGTRPRMDPTATHAVSPTPRIFRRLPSNNAPRRFSVSKTDSPAARQHGLPIAAWAFPQRLGPSRDRTPQGRRDSISCVPSRSRRLTAEERHRSCQTPDAGVDQWGFLGRCFGRRNP